MSLSTGVTMIEVANDLGYYANPISLSNLCQHPNINKWSAWKPVRYNAPTVTDMSIPAIGYGFMESEVEGGIYWKGSNSVLNAAKAANGEWNYLKPNSVYRLGDFRNYNKNATCQFSPDYLIKKTSSTTPQVSMKINTGSTVEIRLQDFDIITSSTVSQNPWRYAVVYRDVNQQQGASYSLSNYYVTGSTSPMSTIECNLNLQQGHTYDCCWVATQETGTTEVGGLGWIYLPYGYWQLTCSIYAVGINFFPYQPGPSVKPFSVGYGYEIGGGHYKIDYVSFNWECYNQNDTGDISNVQVCIEAYNKVGDIWEFMGSGTTTVASIGAKTAALGNTVTYTSYGSAMYPDTGIRIWEYDSGVKKYYEFNDEAGSGGMQVEESTIRSLPWLRDRGWIAAEVTP